MDKTKWVKTTLGEVCSLYQPRTIAVSKLKPDGKYFVYGANGIIGRYDKYNHEGSEILVTCRGATCGTVNISKPYSWINGNAMVVHPKSYENLDSFFLGILVSSIDYTKVITGAAQPQITRANFQKVQVCIPPLSEQQGIATELGAVQEMIDGYKAQIKDLDELAKSIFLDMFGDPISNPKGWKKKKIQDVCIVNPSKHEIDDLIADDEEVSFLPMEDLGLYALHFTPRQSKTLLKVKTAYTYFKEGDIVMAKVTPCFENGKIGIATKLKKGIGFGSSELLVYRSKGEIIQVYSYFVLSSDSFHALGHKNMNGVAGLKRLTKRVSNELQIPIPPFSLQQRFAAKIEAIEKQKELLRQQLSDAETLMAERMQYYFS